MTAYKHNTNLTSIIMKHLFTLCAALLVASAGIAQDFNGYALYANQNQSSAYLIDEDGDIAKNWNLPYSANYACALDDNGNFVFGAVNQGNQLNGPAVGGRVVSIDANNNINWNFQYSTSDYVQHHDICLMPNGNVLLIAWEVRSQAELEQAGYDNPTGEKWSTRIVEVQQNGTSGQVVWEWHMWDHFVQDHDATKDNYGVVADHPELMDVNVETSGGGGGPGGPPGGGGDWFHVNGIDYNPDLDQIAFSARYLSEVFIIDHSTTTAEAAGHTGGNSGKGGDILYRWGNPSNYGAPGAQVVPAAVHDVRWVKPDRPYAGYLQIFNNEGGGNGQSTVDAFNPPLNGYVYDLTPGQAYTPTSYDLRHDCIEDSDGQSASDRMSNGNIFVCPADEYMYEVNDQGTIVWQYAAGPKKAFRYECDHPGIEALLGSDPCGLVSVNDANKTELSIAPNPSTGIFRINGLTTDAQITDITIHDMIGKQVFGVVANDEIDLTGKENGFYFVSINFEGGERSIHKICLNK